MFVTGLFIGYTAGTAVSMIFIIGVLRWMERQELKEESINISKSLEKEMEQLKAMKRGEEGGNHL